MTRQAGARPDIAPCVARNQVLEFGREIRAVLERARDVRIAKHLAPHTQARFVTFVFGHVRLPGNRATFSYRHPLARYSTSARHRVRRTASPRCIRPVRALAQPSWTGHACPKLPAPAP